MKSKPAQVEKFASALLSVKNLFDQIIEESKQECKEKENSSALLQNRTNLTHGNFR